MYQDILEESWVYQEILQKGLLKGLLQGLEQDRQQELQRHRQSILAIAQGRFPELVDLIKDPVENTTDPDVLLKLIIDISCANNYHEVIQAFSETPELKGSTKE